MSSEKSGTITFFYMMFKFQLYFVTSTFAQITLGKVRIQIHMKKELREYYEEEGDRYQLTLDLKRPSL